MTYGLNQTGNGPLAPSVRRNGVFAAACWIHTQFSFAPAAPSIGGRSYLDALSAWYFGGGGGEEGYKLIDSCEGFRCGTNCPAYASAA